MHRVGRGRGGLGRARSKNGDFTVLIGTQSTGQGHETAYAQVVAAISRRAARARSRSCRATPTGFATGNGTGGSRSIPIGAVMVSRASETLAGSLKELAADKLEAAVGRPRNRRRPECASPAPIARFHMPRSPPFPAPRRRSLCATQNRLRRPSATYPNGTHACEVEIDPETGETSIVRYSVVDDFGVHLEPAAA